MAVKIQSIAGAHDVRNAQGILLGIQEPEQTGARAEQRAPKHDPAVHTADFTA